MVTHCDCSRCRCDDVASSSRAAATCRPAARASPRASARAIAASLAGGWVGVSQRGCGRRPAVMSSRGPFPTVSVSSQPRARPERAASLSAAGPASRVRGSRRVVGLHVGAGPLPAAGTSPVTHLSTDRCLTLSQGEHGACESNLRTRSTRESAKSHRAQGLQCLHASAWLLALAAPWRWRRWAARTRWGRSTPRLMPVRLPPACPSSRRSLRLTVWQAEVGGEKAGASRADWYDKGASHAVCRQAGSCRAPPTAAHAASLVCACRTSCTTQFRSPTMPRQACATGRRCPPP